MKNEFQIREGNLIATFDLDNENGDVDFCKLFKVSHGVSNEIKMFVDYEATNKIIKDQSEQIRSLEEQLKNSITPKFKVNQMVYTIRHKNSIYHTRIDEIHICEIKGKQEIFYAYDAPGSYRHEVYHEDCFFATREEAERRLAELEGK